MSQKLPFASQRRPVFRRQNLIEKGMRSYNFKAIRTSPTGGIQGVAGFSSPVNCVYNFKLIKKNRIRDEFHDYLNYNSHQESMSTTYRARKEKREKWLTSFQRENNDELMESYNPENSFIQHSKRLSLPTTMASDDQGADERGSRLFPDKITPPPVYSRASQSSNSHHKTMSSVNAVVSTRPTTTFQMRPISSSPQRDYLSLLLPRLVVTAEKKKPSLNFDRFRVNTTTKPVHSKVQEEEKKQRKLYTRIDKIKILDERKEQNEGKQQRQAKRIYRKLSQTEEELAFKQVDSVLQHSRELSLVKADLTEERDSIIKYFGTSEEGEGEDWLIEEMGATRFNRKDTVVESRLPLEALYNNYAQNIKKQELQKNQKNEAKFVVMTPNKQVLHGYAELSLQDANKTIQIPVSPQKFKEEPLESAINVKNFVSKRKLVEQGRWQDMKALRQRKMKNDAKIHKLKERFSKITEMRDFTEENIKKIEPIEFITLQKEENPVRGPLAANQLQLMLKRQKQSEKQKARFKPERRESNVSVHRRESYNRFSRWYIQQTIRGKEHKMSEKIELDIYKARGGTLSIQKDRLLGLPSNLQMENYERQHSKQKGEEKETALSFDTIHAVTKLKNDPYKRIEKALELFISKRPLRKRKETPMSDTSQYSKLL